MIVKEYLKWRQTKNDHEVPVLETCNNYIYQNKPYICELLGLDNYTTEFELYTRSGFGMETAITGLLDKKPVLSFRFEQMPGCCAIGVTSYLDWEKGISLDSINEFREALAKECKWGILLANLTEDQRLQREALRDRKWEILSDFVNPKTYNRVFVFQKVL